MLTKLSSTKRFQILGGTVVIAKSESLTTTMHTLATTELTGLPMAQQRLYLQANPRHTK